MKEKVSIIIPAYNVEEYIYRAIESSINQTYVNIEIIIVDDGSTDNTWKVIKEYSKKDNRIKAFKQDNNGVSSARNNALSHASGNYIIFLDSDDWLEKNAVSELLKIQINNLNKLVSTNCYFVSYDSEGRFLKEKVDLTKEDIVMSKKESIVSSCRLKFRLASSCYKIFDMRIIKSNNIKFNEHIRYGEDGLFVFTYLNYVDGLIFKDIALWDILDRQGSATTSKYNHYWMTSLEVADEMKKINQDKNIEEEINVYLVRRALTVLRNAISSNTITNEIKKDIIEIRKVIKVNKRFYIKKCRIIKNIIYLIVLTYAPINLLNKYYKEVK